MSKVAKVAFSGYESSITKALDLIDASAKLPDTGLIIIKPNLTTGDKPPVTTNVKAVEAVYKYCSLHSKAEIAVGEGAGKRISPSRNCPKCFYHLSTGTQRPLFYSFWNWIFYRNETGSGFELRIYYI